jgi:hypothetical protein
MSAAEETAMDFHAMSNDFALAVLAYRGHRLDSTLETVERMACSRRKQFKTLVVIVSANFAFSHKSSLPYRRRLREIEESRTAPAGVLYAAERVCAALRAA